jgi:hypothetical protein
MDEIQACAEYHLPFFAHDGWDMVAGDDSAWSMICF